MALDYVRAIRKTQPPMKKKQIQTFTGKLETLNRFIFRYSDRLRAILHSIERSFLKGMGTRIRQGLSLYQGLHRLPSIFVSTG